MVAFWQLWPLLALSSSSTGDSATIMVRTSMAFTRIPRSVPSLADLDRPVPPTAVASLVRLRVAALALPQTNRVLFRPLSPAALHRGDGLRALSDFPTTKIWHSFTTTAEPSQTVSTMRPDPSAIPARSACTGAETRSELREASVSTWRLVCTRWCRMMRSSHRLRLSTET